MSVNDLPPSADSTISHTNKPYTATSTSTSASTPTSELEALDHRLKRLSDDVLPLHPYLLTLPTNAPFRLGSRSANNWAVGHDRPFTHDEQQLQYMTFLTHDSGDSLLLAVGDWSDESGHMMVDQRATSTTTATTTENPRDSVSKKKISLKDYNTQKVTNTTAPTPDNHPEASSASANKREAKATATTTARATTPDTAHTNDKLETRPTHTKPHLSPHKETKKRPSVKGSEIHSMNSPKKQRLSPEKDRTERPDRMERSDRMERPTKSRSPRPPLPALLSPTLPPTSGPRLPRLLSPTLPPDIEKELAKNGGHSPINASRTRRNDEPQSRTPTSMNSGGSGRVGASFKDSSNAPPRRIVSLRYGKANRKRVEALLKFSVKKKIHQTSSTPGPDTDVDDVPQGRREDTTNSRNNLSSKKVQSKGTTNEIPSSSTGRPRESKPTNDKPSTPAFHPPSHDRHRPTPTHLTPSKGISRDSMETDNKTPINPATKRYSTDLGKPSPSAPSSTSHPENRTREQDRRAWREEFQKFSSIGRDLKHASERYTSITGPSLEDEKLSVVTAIEAILSFILAFVADNQCKSLARQVGDSSSWVSILAYWRVVRKKSTPYPILHGLALILGAVSYDSIHALDLERLAVSPLPGEHTPAPTPGDSNSNNNATASQNTPSSDEYKRTWEKFHELKNRLPECYRESQKLWLEGSRCLSEDILRNEFPTVWSGRSRNFAERGRNVFASGASGASASKSSSSSKKPGPGHYPNEYFLPLGGITYPVEIVRFTIAVLREWCVKEGVEWEERVVF